MACSGILPSRKEVPDFEYTLVGAYLRNLATLSQAQTQASKILLRFPPQSLRVRSQAARIREILESGGVSTGGVCIELVSSSQVLANVANLLIRDTELSSFLVAMGDISLRKTGWRRRGLKRKKSPKFFSIILERLLPGNLFEKNTWSTRR
ncbi:hypothetical protein M0R45_002065 [Rubus argutus]|uniref:Uncharacterized protein n=1 Tax=Rubus argutus TaxID=59490 RepID=A0AAW1VDI3_RUBAR